jgi:hypothetical protein
MRTIALALLVPALLVPTLVLPAIAVPRAAQAGITDHAGTWQGTGHAVDVSGKDLGAFTVRVARRTDGPGKLRADGKVRLASGKEIVFWQEFAEGPAGGFRLVTNDGTGSGRCFGNGICQSYEERAGGKAFATTIVMDSPTTVRILVIELDGGRAIRFFHQTLVKAP